MKLRRMAVTGVAIGALLIVASVIWSRAVTAETVWSEAEANELNEAVVQLHSGVHAASGHDERAHFHTPGEIHDHEHTSDIDLVSLRKELSKREADLRAAKFQHKGVPRVLRFLGVAIVAIGGGLFLVLNRSESA